MRPVETWPNLALLGGTPIRQEPWPKWPRFSSTTLEALARVGASSRWTVSGPYTGVESEERMFARHFAAYTGATAAVPVTSGTSALVVALRALGVGRGDEVLVPGLTWVASASAVCALGAVPVLVDVDPSTLTMDAEAASKAITARTKAILVVHLYDHAADLDAYTRLAAAHSLALIEDCAQAHGMHWNDRHVGTHGDVGCFSMQQSKLLTSGEGGAVITTDESLVATLEQLKADGRQPSLTPVTGRLDLVEVGSVQGSNYNLSEFQAAVLNDRLGHLDEENEIRAANAALLDDLLDDVPGVAPKYHDARVTGRTFYNYTVRLDRTQWPDVDLETIATALAGELGFVVNPVYRPLNDHPLLRPANIPPGDMTADELERYDLSRFELPVARACREEFLTLTHPVLLAEPKAMEQVAAAFEKVHTAADKLHEVPDGDERLSF